MDWRRLEFHGMAPDEAFEALCTHLFERWLRREHGIELRAMNALDGCGGDGGVEAYGVLGSGCEVGLQCKWFRTFGAQEREKLRSSVDQAMRRHPLITQYVVAFPINLKDAKSSKGGVSQLNHWDAFTNKYPQVRFVRWDAHRLDALLIGEADIQSHWFSDWLAVEPRARFHRAVSAFRHRYSPLDPLLAGGIEREVALHLRLPSACVSVLAELESTMRTGRRLGKAIQSLEEHPEFSGGPANEDLKAVQRLYEVANATLASLREAWRAGLQPGEDGLASFDVVHSLCSRLGRGDQDGVDPFGPARRTLDNLGPWLEKVMGLRAAWDQYGRPIAIIGPPGCGKSNGVIGAARQHAEERDMPVFLIGARDCDPRNGLQPLLARALDRPVSPVDGALAAMEAEAHAAEARSRRNNNAVGPHPVRTLLIIDGLDESRPASDAWTRVLAELIELLNGYPRIHLVTSVRTSAQRRCIPSGADVMPLHVASTGDVDILELLHAYCETHKIVVEDWVLLAGVLRTPLAIRLFSRLHAGRMVGVGDLHRVALPELIRAWIDELERELRADDATWTESEPIALRAIQVAVTVVAQRSVPVEQDDLVRALVEAMPADSLPRARALRLLDRACEYAVLDRSAAHSPDPLEPSPFRFDLGDETIADFLVGREIARTTRDQLAKQREAPEPPWLAMRRDSAVFATSFLLNEGISIADDTIWPTVTPRYRTQLLLRAATWAQPEALAPLADWVAQKFHAGMVDTRTVTNELVIPTCRRQDHPFGAPWLDRCLSRMSAQQRDILWSSPDDLPHNHGAPWEGAEAACTDSLDLWIGEPWWGAPSIVAWALTSLVAQRVLKSRWKLARWATANPGELFLLLKHFRDVGDPQLREELLLVAAEATLRWPGDAAELLDLANLIADEVFGGDGCDVSGNLRSRVAARIVIEQAAARHPEGAGRLLTRARPPYAQPRQPLPLDTSMASLASRASSRGPVEMLDWDLWSYVIDRPAAEFLRRRQRANKARMPVSLENVDGNVRDLVGRGRLFLSAKASAAARRSWTAHERRGQREHEKQEDEHRRLKALFQTFRGDARVPVEAKGSADAPDSTEPTVRDTAFDISSPNNIQPQRSELSAAAERLVQWYAKEYGLNDLTFRGMVAGIVVAHIRSHGWATDVHTMDPRGGDEGERLGFDIAIKRKYGHAMHGSRSDVARVAEKYAFTGVHELLGHLSTILPWWNEHAEELGPSQDEIEIASDLLQGFPSRGGRVQIPPSEPWVPPLAPPEVSTSAPELVERSSEKVLALTFPEPSELLAGPIPGSIVLAAETVMDSFGSEPRPSLWVSALSAPLDQIALFERDIAAGLHPGDYLHETLQAPEGTYVPTDIVAVSQWIPLHYGRAGYVTVDAAGRAVAIDLSALAGRNLDHDGGAEVNCLFPAELLRRMWPVVKTLGGDDDRVFLDPTGRTRAFSQRTVGDRAWEESSNVLFVDLVDLIDTLHRENLGVVWAIRLYWEVPGRLWSKGSSAAKEIYPSVRSREARWIVANDGGSWRTLWEMQDVERAPKEPPPRDGAL